LKILLYICYVSCPQAFEDAEFHQMEEEVNKEAQRDDIFKSLGDIKKRLLSEQSDLEQLRHINRVSIGASAKEIQVLEKRRQELIKEFQRVRKIFH